MQQQQGSYGASQLHAAYQYAPQYYPPFWPAQSATDYPPHTPTPAVREAACDRQLTSTGSNEAKTSTATENGESSEVEVRCDGSGLYIQACLGGGVTPPCELVSLPILRSMKYGCVGVWVGVEVVMLISHTVHSTNLVMIVNRLGKLSAPPFLT